MNVFTLGAMRHLDLLAVYWRLGGETRTPGFKAGEEYVPQLSKEGLINLILLRVPDASAR